MKISQSNIIFLLKIYKVRYFLYNLINILQSRFFKSVIKIIFEVCQINTFSKKRRTDAMKGLPDIEQM